MKRIITILLFATSCFADRASDIAGPVIAVGSSPWSAWDVAIPQSVDNYIAASLAYPPLLGSALPGTYTFQCAGSACNSGNRSTVTLVGTTAPGVSTSDQIVVAWNSVDGTGQGRLYGTVASVSGNTIAFNVNGNGSLPLPSPISTSSPQSGLTVYACTRCVVDISDPGGTGVLVYSCGSWGVSGCSNGVGGWSFYDANMAVYRMYQRTGDASYLTSFCDIAQLQWIWTMQSGTLEGVSPPRFFPLLSQFMRTLVCGHPEALAGLHYMLSLNVTFNVLAYPNGQDNREPGVILNAIATGARADSDPTRHASYCSMLTSLTDYWLAIQRPGGWWDEKNTVYPYAMPGVSPWRMLYTTQGLARAYDVFIDTTSDGCNDATRAAQALAAVEAAGAYMFNGGFNSSTKAIAYDTEHPNNGRDYTRAATQGACTVTVGSASFTCVGSQLQTDFNCNGTDFIGFEQVPTGYSWVGKLNSCSSQTAGTLSAVWGGPMQTTYDYSGAVSAPSFTGITYDAGLTRSLPASTDCHSTAAYCVDFGDSQQMGYKNRAGNFDVIWTLGWLGSRTGDSSWFTKGDQVFGAAYGAPADGPGGSSPCDGPYCDGYNEGLSPLLTGCAYSAAPCNPYTNYPGLINTYSVGSRPLGQMAGIGGGDNYLAWRVGATPTPPTITTSCPLPSGTQGAAYSQSVSAVGDTPITWDLSTGTLPTGLALSSGGSITGTPSGSGTSSFTLRATNATGNDTESCSLTIAASGGGSNGSRKLGGQAKGNIKR